MASVCNQSTVTPAASKFSHSIADLLPQTRSVAARVYNRDKEEPDVWHVWFDSS